MQERGSSSSLSTHSHCSSLSSKFSIFSSSISFFILLIISLLTHTLLLHTGMVQSLVLVLCNLQTLPSSAAVGTEQSWHRGNGFCPIIPPKLHLWLWFQSSAIILCPHLLLFCTASDGTCECLPVCVWHGAISVSGLSLEGMPSLKTLKASEIFCSPYGGFCLQMCVLCWLGSVPSYSRCPCRPCKDAITESLATVARAPLLDFVQANKR